MFQLLTCVPFPNASYSEFELTLIQGGKQKKKLPRRPNDLPHRHLVLYLNLPNDHGHFDEVQLEFKTKFRKKGSIIAQYKS